MYLEDLGVGDYNRYNEDFKIIEMYITYIEHKYFTEVFHILFIS